MQTRGEIICIKSLSPETMTTSKPSGLGLPGQSGDDIVGLKDPVFPESAGRIAADLFDIGI